MSKPQVRSSQLITTFGPGAMVDLPDDAALLDRYAETRDAEAFATLVRRYAGLVYGTCLRITANAHDAEDAAQECFMDLARQTASISTSLPGWLHTTATGFIASSPIRQR